MPMVDKADDAIALWQQMVGEMQKGFRTFGDRFSQGASGETSPGCDSAQKQLANLMESYFAGMNLPSRTQLNGLADRLQAIEGELTDIKALLHEALMNSRPAEDPPKPTQPRQPPPRPKRPAQAKSRAVPPAKEAPLVPEENSGADDKSE
jgi:hypothetical protein